MRWRLVAVLVGLVAVVLLVHDVPLASHLRRVERDRIVTGLERDAFVIAGRAVETLGAGRAAGDPSLQQLVDAYRSDTDARVVVTDRAGTAMVISDEDAAAGADYSTRPEIAAAASGEIVSGRRESRTLGTELLFVSVPVLSGDEVVGVVRLTYPASAVDERVERRVRGLVVVAAISVLMALVAALVFATTVTRPLRRLRDATERLASGEEAVQAPDDDGPPEVRSLARAFNAMSSRLSALMDAQRAFAGDASHQLRTPLTALRLRLDQAAATVDDDPDATRLRIEAATAETERLQHLVDQLLMLARTEGRAVEQVVVDLARVARERVEMWQPLAAEQDVTVTCSTPDSAPVRAAPEAAEQVIDNYVDNALAVAPTGSTLEVVVRRDGGDVVVEVLDRGPGMSDEQRAHAFDRFWRAPGSVSGGSGLGLAIVRRLVDASGGAVSLAPREGGGTVASAVFRSARAPG
jgi:signal transduction histidine kinase